MSLVHFEVAYHLTRNPNKAHGIRLYLDRVRERAASAPPHNP